MRGGSDRVLCRRIAPAVLAGALVAGAVPAVARFVGAGSTVLGVALGGPDTAARVKEIAGSLELQTRVADGESGAYAVVQTSSTNSPRSVQLSQSVSIFSRRDRRLGGLKVAGKGSADDNPALAVNRLRQLARLVGETAVKTELGDPNLPPVAGFRLTMTNSLEDVNERLLTRDLRRAIAQALGQQAFTVAAATATDLLWSDGAGNTILEQSYEPQGDDGLGSFPAMLGGP
jgi:hypothetical protein